jgi:transcription elongation factor GreB
VVDPAAQTRRDQVFFGATVTYAREDDAEVSVTIVGVDETDGARRRISWVSPVARALLGKRVGDVVKVRMPQGVEEVELLAIEYPRAQDRC